MFKYKKKNHSSNSGYLNTTRESRYFSGGAGVNLFTYFGDLTPKEQILKNSFKVTRPGFSVFADYHFSNQFGVKGELSYGRITGDDFNTSPDVEGSSTRHYVRNLSMRNDIVGLSFFGYMHILNDPFEYFKRRDYNIYLLTGISIYYSNPKAKVPEPFDDAGEWVALRPLGTEGQNHPEIGNKYSAIQFGIPLGLGVRIRIGYRLDLNLEASLQYILSDYIDDIGNSYVDLGVFEDELAKALSDRSKEEKAVMKNENRDQNIIDESTTEYVYESKYDNKTYNVFEGFGHEDGIRGGDKNDLITITSFKFSYIFTN
ncbi:MAG: outer membrane beta-barrel protein [Cyclobacteriaceae bacterium]|nr:outer membrane beta-barrel protein [Cyclobacteriaceae bacterium]